MLFCTPCLQILPIALKCFDSQSYVDSKVKTIEQSHSEIQNTEKRLSETIERVEIQFNKHYKSINTMLNGLESRLKEPAIAMEQEENIMNRLAAAVTINTFTEIFDEYRDRERSKFNVIIYNAPESEAEDSSKRNKDDVSFVNTMTKKFVIPLGEIVQLGGLG